MRASSTVRPFALCLPVLLFMALYAHANEKPSATRVRLQAIVDVLCGELAIEQKVTLALVPENPLMASVEPVKGGGGFLLAIEEAFADRLTEEELKGVIAHELGHVWIYTHHPYLQTERGANRIAMRLVSRETLELVYEKVWKNGIKDNHDWFLDAPAAAPAKAALAPPAAATTPLSPR